MRATDCFVHFPEANRCLRRSKMLLRENLMADESLRRALEDQAGRIFAPFERLDPADGAGCARLWDAIEEAGLTASLAPEAAGGLGLAAADAFVLAEVAAAHAVPVALAETMIARLMLAHAGLAAPEGELAVGPVRRGDRARLAHRDGVWRLSGTLRGVPFARRAAALMVIADTDKGSRCVLVRPGGWQVAPAVNLAGEPRDDVTFDLRVEADAVGAPHARVTPEALMALGAAIRTAQMAGALQRVLALTVAYVQEREQFGRPLSKFQAVQQAVATLAGQAAAAGASAAIAADGVDAGLDLVAIGAAKARAGEAAGLGCPIAHQAFGAMGYARETPLNHYTRRLSAWRGEFGTDSHWQEAVGRALAKQASSVGGSPWHGIVAHELPVSSWPAAGGAA